MAHFPFHSRYPYTNFEQLNLDYLLNETSKFSKRVEDLETITANHEVRIGTLETNVEDLTGRVGVLETDVGDLKDRMTEAEGDIDNLQSRMNDVEDDVEDLEGRVSTLETDMTGVKSDISGLETRVSNNEANITNLITENGAQNNQILQLGSRVTELENHSVIANPGGTGANLNTISVDGVTYVVPQGGGGGGGSVVTANPAGVLPTDPELSSLGIDDLNYRIPVTAADKAAIESDISVLDDRVDILETAITQIDTRIGSVIRKSFLTETILNSLMPDADAVIELDGTQRVTSDQTASDTTIVLQPGVYLLTLETDFDTTAYGSTPRFLGAYIRNSANNANMARGKYSVFGTERAMITQAASINCSTVVTVLEGTTLTVHAAVRCNGANPSPTQPKRFKVENLEFTAIKLGVIS